MCMYVSVSVLFVAYYNMLNAQLNTQNLRIALIRERVREENEEIFSAFRFHFSEYSMLCVIVVCVSESVNMEIVYEKSESSLLFTHSHRWARETSGCVFRSSDFADCLLFGLLCV